MPRQTQSMPQNPPTLPNFMSTLLVAAIAVITGAAVSYLFLRVNPKKRAKLDSFVEKAKNEIDGY